MTNTSHLVLHKPDIFCCHFSLCCIPIHLRSHGLLANIPYCTEVLKILKQTHTSVFNACVYPQHINIKMKTSSAHLGNNIFVQANNCFSLWAMFCPSSTQTHGLLHLLIKIIETLNDQQHSWLAFTPTFCPAAFNVLHAKLNVALVGP